MATVVNTRDVLLLSAPVRILTIALPTNITIPKTQVTGLGQLASKDTVAQADFSTGLEPVALVSSLPNPTGYTGVKVVFLTTTGKLYRYVSGAWTVAVPAVDITGALSDSQISDISAAKLTGQITATQITDGAISTPKLAAGSVSAANIAAGAVTAGKVAAGAITATEIAAGAITTSKIAANAITTSELAANAVTAGVIAAGAITASKIAAGTITATEISSSYVYAGTINADNITSGTITGRAISGGTITGATISGGTTTGTTMAGHVLNITTVGFAPLLSVSASGITFGNYIGATFNKGITVSDSATEPVRATSTSSSYGAALFINSALGKQLAVAGSYAAYAGSGQGKIYAVDGFTPFTGSHQAFMPKGTKFEIGDIVYDKEVIVKHDVSNTITEVALCYKPAMKSVVGIIAETYENPSNDLDLDEELWYNICNNYSLHLINGVGEGMLNVCGEGGNIEAGDLICSSSLLGKGMKQSDDIVRNITVAKAREDVVFKDKNEVKQIACIYLCG